MSNLTQELESLVRTGQLKEARLRLRELRIRTIAREDAASVANAARRVGLGSLSLRILSPIVRPQKARGVPASAVEVIEYAASLRGLGAESEAASLLQGIDLARNPQAAFQLALCWIVQWRYEEAIPLLQAFIRSASEATYGSMVAKLNLLDSLTRERRFDEARSLMQEIRTGTDPEVVPVLYRKWLELAAQLEIAEDRWSAAIARLTEAARGTDEAQDPLGALFISKWLAIARSQELGRAAPELRSVRDQAMRLGNWETVRDCDFHLARIESDLDALIRIYFGTPFESYRRIVLECLEGKAMLPERFCWAGGQVPDLSTGIDLTAARVVGSRAGLVPGQSLHRLLIALSRDFYRPVPAVRLFTMLFPDEAFHADHSPPRVRQVIIRFREWANSAGVMLEVVFERGAGGYRLKFGGPRPLILPRVPLPVDEKELRLAALIGSLGSSQAGFSVPEAMRALDMSRSSIKRLLAWAVEQEMLERTGKTHQVHYRTISQSYRAKLAA